VKKRQLDHVLRAAGEIVDDTQFIIIGSQALHGKFPDLPDDIVMSAEVDLFAKNRAERTEWLNAIGVDSPFHATHGYYADPVDEKTAVLPKGWKARLVNLAPGDTNGVSGLCLDPHDIAISKYVAKRDKDIEFNRELVRRGIVGKERLFELLEVTPVPAAVSKRVRADINRDFAEAIR
jgi:hypothetical protein